MLVFATDLDGTLLRSDGLMSAATLRELRSLRQSGVLVVVATARPLRMVRSLAGVVSVSDYVICDNGCLTWQLRPETLLLHQCWTRDEAERLCVVLRRSFPNAPLAIEAQGKTVAERRFVAIAGHQLDLVGTDIVDRLDCPHAVSKILLARGGSSADELVDVIAPALGEICNVTHSGSIYLELGPRGVTKGSALRALCDGLGHKRSDVAACGDMPNDVDMLRWAGLGVAMGHAHPDALAVADLVTATNDADGVAEVIRAVRGARSLGALAHVRPWDGNPRLGRTSLVAATETLASGCSDAP